MGQIKQIHIAYDYFDDSSPVGAQSSFMQEISQGNSVGRRRDPPLLWLWLLSIEGVWGIHFFYDLLAADLLTGSGENREVFFFLHYLKRERKVQPISCMRPAGKGKKKNGSIMLGSSVTHNWAVTGGGMFLSRMWHYTFTRLTPRFFYFSCVWKAIIRHFCTRHITNYIRRYIVFLYNY